MQRHPSGLENKLLLLHAIECLGAVTGEQLLQFMVENDFMDYISLQLGLSELVESALLRKISHPLGELFALTGKGRDTLPLFRNKVPHSKRAAVTEQAKSWRLRFKREKQMLADIEEGTNGEFFACLRLIERDSDLLTLRVSVPSHKQAQRFCDAWIAQAPNVYQTIMRALGEGDKEPSDGEL